MAGGDVSHVLVGVDDTESSLHAVRYAAREAADHGRSLTVLHAFNWAAAETEPGGQPPCTAAEALLDRAVKTAEQVAPGLAVRGELAEGPAVASLVRHSEHAALVALGDGDLDTCGCVRADTPALQVAARAGAPVLVVRRKPPPNGPVLVGVDGSPASRAALTFALGCAARRGADVLVVRVDDPDDRGSGPADDLDGTVTRARGAHPDVRVETRVITGEAGPVMVEQARHAALSVVGSRGTEPYRGMLGEVSQSLLYHSPGPVVVVRGRYPDDWGREAGPPVREDGPSREDGPPVRDQRP